MIKMDIKINPKFAEVPNVCDSWTTEYNDGKL